MWHNPVVLGRKKIGKLRFCVDFRRLNECVDLDGFKIPKISELLSILRDQKYFTILDLTDAYFQIDIETNDKEKTTFSTGEALYQFTKMPQGFKNSPGIFQKEITLILRDLTPSKCIAYVDDIMIFG